MRKGCGEWCEVSGALGVPWDSSGSLRALQLWTS